MLPKCRQQCFGMATEPSSVLLAHGIGLGGVDWFQHARAVDLAKLKSGLPASMWLG